ncbi:DegT/DnrJ/EryC1/StrS family aminotransferase [Schlesneria paludicola]|uniref:DegT/DnrJ/EryC1/StrS family aminotransferase n=1 Tax=Schlesneria paludicola TaxID=360056 RepID=UPI000299EACD|nr:aminotransferase class V-fold PLP-dependent enzyme [Schlesneria paludicola]
MNLSDLHRPAILGGKAVFPQGAPTWPRSDQALRTVFEELFMSGNWGRYHGPHVPELVRQLADDHGVEHVLLCSSGTSAVELALRGAGVGPGDEVIMAAYDFKANFQNVLCLGAVPVLIDLHPVTWQIDPTRIAAAVSPRTRAILVSHLHGGVVEMAEVCRHAAAQSIPVVEDACQNPGAIVFGRKAGTWGDVGVHSFGGSKLLTAGRGGALLSRRADIAERIKRYTQRGNDAYPLSEMQAAVLLPQLQQLGRLNTQRRIFVAKLASLLKDVPGLELLQVPADAIEPAYYKVGFRYESRDFQGMNRNQFAAAMRAEGIALDPGFRGLHLIHASRRFRRADELNEATRADAGMLTLHHPVLLAELSAVDSIVAAVTKIRQFAGEIAAAVQVDSPQES